MEFLGGEMNMNTFCRAPLGFSGIERIIRPVHPSQDGLGQ
jgi:hypothetical protein